jgi:3-methyladenine DNA glycosylase AlkD
MDKVETLAAEIRAYCAANADPARAARYERYFKEGYDAWGLMGNDHPFWSEKQNEWTGRYGGIGLRGFLRLGNLLFAGGKYEEGAMAIRMVARLRGEFDARSLASLGKWFAAGIGNWAHTDTLCSEVIAPLLAGGRIPLEALDSWRRSKFRYQRRAVLVAMLGLLKTETGAGPLLRFIRPMMLDGERVVHQGLGWFLREAWKKEPAPVEAFLAEWKEEAARLIYQYATEKMTPEKKALFRRVRN